MLRLERELHFPILAGLLLAVLGGCKGDKCEELAAQAQIDVELEGIATENATGSEVTLTINDSHQFKHIFAEAGPSFVFKFEEYDQSPRTLAITVDVFDRDRKMLGSGQLETKFSSDACNFFTVSVNPGDMMDGGIDGITDALSDIVSQDVTTCGNGNIDSGEECDGIQLDGQTCQSKGFDDGALACDSNCMFDTSGCTYLSCGDGKVSGNEDCDGSLLGSETCETLGHDGGTIGCNPNCTYDESGCYDCGDGIKNGNEECDGTALGGATCASQGFDGGTLKCDSGCKLDTASCHKCLDGKISGPEECDGSNLGGATCETLGWDGGTLLCANTCAFNESGCYKCGDGFKNGPAEQCDGSDLGGNTCATLGLGFGGGTLTCTTICAYSVSGCSTADFAQIAKGTFSMGSPTSEPCRSNDETQHQVTLTQAFEMSVYEVTQGEFLSLMGYNPSNFTSCGTTCPVEKVSWHEAAAYCNTLSSQKGLIKCYSCSGTGASVTCSEAASYSGANIYDCPGYRLPTDAEWERAYRAGSSTPFYPSTGNDGSITNCNTADSNAEMIGWYSANSGATTHPKGQKSANSWGLYDMAGNVWEWCHDWYQFNLGSTSMTDPWGPASGSDRVVRGGGWEYDAFGVRAAYRNYCNAPTSRGINLGFRCARTKN